MTIFFRTLAKTLGFFTAIFILLLISIIIIEVINSNKNNGTSYFKHTAGNKNSTEIISILNINGPIISEPSNFNNFNLLGNNEVIYPSLIENYLKELDKKNIKGLIISINSPGGSVHASQKIYSLLNLFKKKNNIPLYFHSTNIIASGGYWISLSGDMIFAEYGTLIGSIGVKGPDWLYYNSPTAISSGILGKSIESPNGIKLFSSIAGNNKDIFNPFRIPTDEEIFKLQQIVNDIYKDFVNLVSINRKLEKELIIKDIGAMIFNTKRAKLNYLIDGEKNIDEVIEFMSKKLNLSDKKIIKNKNNKNYSIININIKNYLQTLYLNNNLKDEIKESICNNYFNEFSAISRSVTNSSC